MQKELRQLNFWEVILKMTQKKLSEISINFVTVMIRLSENPEDEAKLEDVEQYMLRLYRTKNATIPNHHATNIACAG